MVVAVVHSRLLRRVLLVAAVAVGGWLLSVLVAGTASADQLPEDDSLVHRGQSGGLLGRLLGDLTGSLDGVTDIASGVTGALVGTPADRLSPSVTPPAPVVDEPETLPADSSADVSARDTPTDPIDVPRAETLVTPDAPKPTAVTPAVAPVVTVPAADAVPPTAPVAQDLGLEATEHAEQGDGHQRQPAKAPTTPGGTGTTASTTHDSSGSGRGTHDVLPAQAVLHPAGAGYTTRSLAVDAAGRTAGLPASSPD